MAIDLALRSFANLHHTTVLICTDNTTAKAYVNRRGGTKSRKRSQLAISIWERCLQNGLRIQAQHIPGIQNKTADYASRHFSTKDLWQLIPTAFQQIQTQWGPHDVDLFARPDIQSTSATRLLEARPGSTSNGCAIHSMEPISESLPQPTLEPNPLLSQENTDGESSTGHDSGAILADSHMVPSTTTDGDAYTNTDRPPTADTRHCFSITSPWTNKHWKFSVWRVSGTGFNY